MARGHPARKQRIQDSNPVRALAGTQLRPDCRRKAVPDAKTPCGLLSRRSAWALGRGLQGPSVGLVQIPSLLLETRTLDAHGNWGGASSAPGTQQGLHLWEKLATRCPEPSGSVSSFQSPREVGCPRAEPVFMQTLQEISWGL